MGWEQEKRGGEGPRSSQRTSHLVKQREPERREGQPARLSSPVNKALSALRWVFGS